MKKLLIAIAALFMFSCGGQKEKEENVEVVMSKHGAEISVEDAKSMNEFSHLFVNKDSMEVKISGTIEDVCQTKGCWMTVYMDDSSTMMVRFKDYEFFVPKDAHGKTAIMDGYAFIDTISVEDQKHYLEDRNATKEEIDAITEPEITYSFEASGVIIKEEIVLSDEK